MPELLHGRAFKATAASSRAITRRFQQTPDFDIFSLRYFISFFFDICRHSGEGGFIIVFRHSGCLSIRASMMKFSFSFRVSLLPMPSHDAGMRIFQVGLAA